jgi:TorA maturation chaperone TorD
MMEAKSYDLIRANVYSLLAALLVRPPSGGILELLTGIIDDDLDDGFMADAWRRLKRAGDCTTVSELDDEFHDLFIGVGRGELVPYGSWYMTGSIMGKSLVRLRADLAVLGFDRQTGVAEPEDHVAALCETMAIIISSAGDIAHEIQQQFFCKHIKPWIKVFFRDLQEAKSACFYRAAGRLGEKFIKIEEQYLAENLNGRQHGRTG